MEETPAKPDGSLNPLAQEKVVIGGKPVFGNGKPKARNYGAGIRKYTSHFGDKTEAEIQRIADNDQLPLMKRTAARLVIRASKMDRDGIALAMELIKHTDGTAVKRIDISGKIGGNVTFVHAVFSELTADVREVLDAQPRRRVGPGAEGGGE
jgi:hypothetical protein